MEVRVSCDDGMREDLQVAELLSKYKIRGTFYVAPYYAAPNRYPLKVKELKEIAKKHEIGGHTLTHVCLTGTTRENGIVEVMKGKLELEQIIGKKLRRFAYPKGYFDENAKDIVKSCGFKEARTMKTGVTDRTGYDNFEIPVTCHVYPRRIEQFPDLWKEAQKGGYFHLVLHSWELTKFGLWEKFEQTLKMMTA